MIKSEKCSFISQFLNQIWVEIKYNLGHTGINLALLWNDSKLNEAGS